MRLPNTAHTSRPWRIHELTHGFRLEDVWGLPTPGGPDDFPRLVQLIALGDPSQGTSRTVRMLWAVRWKLGELLGWDDPDAGLGSTVPTLRDRVPADLRHAPSGPDLETLPFTSLYLIDDEWAAEIANRTVHAVIHVGWVPDQMGNYRGEMGVYVKRNGLLGTTYMTAITPFRHLIVYPAMMRQLEQRWRAQTPGALVDEDRWGRLESMASARRTSVATLIREAIDLAFPPGEPTVAEAAERFLARPALDLGDWADAKRDIEDSFLRRLGR